LLTEENIALSQEIEHQIAAREEAVTSLNEYKETFTVSQPEYDELLSRVDSLSLTRTYSIFALVLVIIGGVYIYLRGLRS
jgi:hypothetical protein